MRVNYRGRNWGTSIFLMLWICGWTVGCMAFVFVMLRQPTLFTLLFALPFWAAWFFTFAVLINSFLRTEELLLDRQGISYTKRALLPLDRRSIPVEELKKFGRYTTVSNSDTGSYRDGLELKTLGRALRCFEGMHVDELAWLEHQLNEMLTEVRSYRMGSHERQLAREDVSVAQPAPDTDTWETLESGNIARPPSDCQWQREDEATELVFTCRGRFSLQGVLVMLFLNCFWNGIVSVFVVGVLVGDGPGPNPAGLEWWGLLVFLIPFEVIGLVMFCVLLALVLEPAHRETWKFAAHEIEHRHTWFGIGPRWTWSVTGLDRIELGMGGSRLKNLRPSLEDVSSLYRLRLVDKQQSEVCSVEGLTEGEARWIGQTLLSERANWFR